METQQIVSIAVLSTEQDDVEIVNSTLRGAGFAAHCRWIRTRQEFDRLLDEASPELIVLNCDTYPDSIRQTSHQKETHCPEVPIIAACGEVSEERIQKAMEDGACDLVSMGNKSRIRSVFTREIRSFRVERALDSTLQSATEYRKQLNAHVQGSSSAIAYVREGIVVKVNQVWLRLFKIKNEKDVQGLPIMDSFAPGSQAAIKGAIVATTKNKWQPDEKLIAKINLGDQQETELELGFQLMDFGDGPQVQIRIAPPQKAIEEPTMIVHEALKRDPTTLFFNRTTFLERIKRRLRKKPSSGQYSLAYIKPDKFSDAKKAVGILRTEDILSQFAEEVRKRMHPRDMAGRFEGTSLLVLLHRGNERDAEVWGQQLVDHVMGQTFRIGDKEVKLTCSVGIVAFSGVYSTMEELVSSVAGALEKAKSDGGNSVYLESSTGQDTRVQKYDEIWIRRIKAALTESRFRLAQLPIAGLRSDSVKMFDMLVRMIDEQGNAVLPAEFVAPAERNNLMMVIDRWIVMASADYCRSEGADRVFVRLSQQSIRDKQLATWMEKEICGRRVNPSLVCVQVPENVAAKHIKETKRAVDSLRHLGIGFALEHYGVNKNRFQILDVLQPDYIKIDGELMHSLTSDTPLQEKVQELARAAAQRNIQTIAERVENANAMAVLFQLGIDFMQGHYVHEPEVVLQEHVNVAHTTLEAIAGS